MEQYINFLSAEWPLTLAFVVIAVLLVRSFIDPMVSAAKDIKAQDAVRIMNKENTLVLDVRLEKEYKEGHILDAIHIPVGALESRIKEIADHKTDNIIIYCQTGMRSKQAGKVLKKHGFESMFNIEGGINAWINANLPINKSSKRKQKK